MKAGIFALAFASLNELTSATSCGLGDEWTYCSAEYEYCTITNSDARSGYIAYGKSGKYTLIPFGNKGSGDLRFYCGNNFGDVIVGTVKECCYKSVSRQGAVSLAGTYDAVTEGETIYFGNLDSSINYLVEYGADGESFYRPVSNAPMYCGNTMFNDPIIGTVKSCVYNESPLAELPAPGADDWVYCGSEGGYCTGIETSTTEATWIKYGASDQYYYKQVYTTDGSVPCTNGFFEDSIYGTYKYCWLAETDSSKVSSSVAFTRKVNGVIYSAKTFDISKVGMVNLIAMLISVITVVALGVRYCLQRKEKLQYESLV
eukprot:CAMPEP_0197074742 /NCGR_PEP_ID=MMETSP1384-20130603/211260_1 /TAXON_ID=29189 /ORGANISM="Ammonia sp." /LENGTH=315 /DNA_ID=CAMNT_0042513583 /DNA_START=85 /DNA_END=1032 /DNA_ORIENTATION=-